MLHRTVQSIRRLSWVRFPTALKDGGRSTPRPFQIKLENCDTATKEVTVTFAGTGSQVIPGKLAITGTASGAAIGINFGDTEIELGTATPAQNDGRQQPALLRSLPAGWRRF